MKSLEDIFENVYNPDFDIDSMRPLLTNDFFKIDIQKIEIAILKDRYTKTFNKELFKAKALKPPKCCNNRLISNDEENGKTYKNSKDDILKTPNKSSLPNPKTSKDPKYKGTRRSRFNSRDKYKSYNENLKTNLIDESCKKSQSEKNDGYLNVSFVPTQEKSFENDKTKLLSPSFNIIPDNFNNENNNTDDSNKTVKIKYSKSNSSKGYLSNKGQFSYKS